MVPHKGVIHQYKDALEKPTEKTLFEAVERGLRTFATKKVIIDGSTGAGLTGQQVLDYTNALSKVLTDKGFRKGDTAAICIRNDLFYPIIMMAISRNGGTATTANPILTAEELIKQLSDSQSKIVFYDDCSKSAVQQVASELSCIQETIQVSHDENGEFKKLLKDQEHAEFQPILGGDNDVAILPYSSGTTGLPKGVMLSHRSVVHTIATCKFVLDLKDDDVTLAFTPFFHVMGIFVMLSILANGAVLVFMSKFNFTQFLQIVQDYKITIVPIVPPIAISLIQLPIVHKYDLTSLKLIIIGAAPISQATEKSLGELIPSASIRQGYGMTEAPVVTHFTGRKTALSKAGSCGLVVPFYESKVTDDNGQLLGPHEHGSILVRGPQVMNGYLGKPGDTAAMISEDGWVFTGDIGYYDEDGYYYIVDRAKELIKWKGFQVAPAELEALLLKHPGVKDVAVIGLPDERAGELPLAFIVRKSGHESLSESDLEKYVEAHVSEHKKLRGGVRFIDVIPKSETGKILRRVLKAGLVKS